MSTRQLSGQLEKYQKARREFVQVIADMATRPENIPAMLNADVIRLLRPLLLDSVSAIQQTASLAIGRLANYKESVAEGIVDGGVLPDIVAGLSSSDDYYQRNACFVIRTIAKHSIALAQQCVDAGALGPLVVCLESFDAKVRESATAALGAIGGHTPELAQAVVDANAIKPLIHGVQDPEPGLKRIAVSTLGELSKHSQELAQAAIDAHAITDIACLLRASDGKLRERACVTLGQIAKHSVESAELVVEGQIFPYALLCLKDTNAGVRTAAAGLVRDVVMHTQELSQLVVTVGGGEALVGFLKPEARNDPLDGVMAVGYIASFSHSLGTALINEGAPGVVLKVFVSSHLNHVRAAAAWALGQLGKHSSEHAGALSGLNALSLLLDGHNDPTASDDLKLKARRAMKFVVEKTIDIEALQPLIGRAPEKILKYVLAQISKLLPKYPKARVPFVQSGGFQAVQKIQAEAGSKLRDYIEAINSCFPDQAVRFSAPQYPEALMKEMETFDT